MQKAHQPVAGASSPYIIEVFVNIRAAAAHADINVGTKLILNTNAQVDALAMATVMNEEGEFLMRIGDINCVKNAQVHH